jgi:predicted MFS family arabinose efflux permease
VSYNTARLIGPAIGGGLVAAIGPGPCFAINALSYLAVILAVATLPASAGVAPRMHTRIRAAVSEARLDPILHGLILGAVLFSILVAPVQELAPVIAREHGDGAHLLGFLLTALAAGGLIGNVVRARLDRRGVPVETAIGASMWLCAVMLLVVAASPSYFLVLAAMVACGAAWDVLYVNSLTGVQFADPQMSGLMTRPFLQRHARRRDARRPGRRHALRRDWGRLGAHGLRGGDRTRGRLGVPPAQCRWLVMR